MYEFKLFDFYVYNKYIKGDPDQDNNVFTIQMFGLNELGETASITVNNFKPFLYILVDDTWEPSDVPEFIGNIKTHSFKEVWESANRKDTLNNLNVDKCPHLCVGDNLNEFLEEIRNRKSMHPNFL